MEVKFYFLIVFFVQFSHVTYPAGAEKSFIQPEESEIHNDQNRHVRITRVEWSYKDQVTVLSTQHIDTIILPHHFSYLKIDFSIPPDEVYPITNFRYAVIHSGNKINWTDLSLKSYVILTT